MHYYKLDSFWNWAFTGQGWFNTATSIAYRYTGSAWVQESGIQSVTVSESTPLSIVVNNPDEFTANITLTLDTQVANSVFAGPTSGSDAAPTFRTLVPADLPDATSSAKGIIQPGTGLAVSSGTLNHSNSVTSATVSGITFDAQGHVSAATALVANDIPSLDASKVTSGTFLSDRIGANTITAAKLANKSTASIGETLPSRSSLLDSCISIHSTRTSSYGMETFGSRSASRLVQLFLLALMTPTRTKLHLSRMTAQQLAWQWVTHCLRRLLLIAIITWSFR